MPNKLHTHRFGGVTTYYEDHDHAYASETSASPNQAGHIHYMIGDTTTEDGHFHNYVAFTGPAIYFNGGHCHIFRSYTNVEHGHVHLMNDFTSSYSG